MSNEQQGALAVKPLRVLIADDSGPVRSSLSSLISRVPNVKIVGMAESGTEAIDLLHTLKPEVMTLDIRMPEMNGISVLEIIKRQKHSVYVIVLTGFVEAEYRQKCLELGARHFLHKSTEFEKVLEILTDLAGDSRSNLIQPTGTL